MKKRYVYALLFGAPGFFVSGMISIFVAGASLGLLWIYVFGDNPRPASTETTIAIGVVLTFFILWICFLTLGYVIGKRLENEPTINTKHILISGGLTLLFILFIVLQQWSVGNLGPKSDGVLCSEYCTRQGYSASGMPLNSGERTCSCYDSSGNEALRVKLDGTDLDTSR